MKVYKVLQNIPMPIELPGNLDNVSCARSCHSQVHETGFSVKASRIDNVFRYEFSDKRTDRDNHWVTW